MNLNQEISHYTLMLMQTPGNYGVTQGLIVSKLQKLLDERYEKERKPFGLPREIVLKDYHLPQNANSETLQVRPSSDMAKGLVSRVSTPPFPSLTPGV